MKVMKTELADANGSAPGTLPSELSAEELRRISRALVTIVRRGASQTSHRDRLERADVQLSFPGAHILDECCRRGPSRVTDLADALQMPVPMVSREANRLIGDGHLERRPDPGDGRITILEVTPNGRTCLERYQAVVDGQLGGVLSGWAPAEVAQLTLLLERFVAGRGRRSLE